MLATPSLTELRQHVAQARAKGLKVGLVPTMGALHAGHRSLVETCRSECGFVVATIFVNPTQFGPNEDFTRYPRTLEADLEMCRAAGADLVFHPETASVYPEGFSTYVDVEGITARLEGESRPGHFRGVATVVLKLFNMAQADVAYFGQKDYQQQLLIRTMCRDLDVPIEIRTCPTIREPDGLALSSRNRYLSPAERAKALSLSKALRMAERLLQAGEKNVSAVRAAMMAVLEEPTGVRVDYASVSDPHTLAELTTPQPEMVALVAARVGTTRLIDNLWISIP
ncbi:MAG: pantoate--beta-alanine ligase [Planctomycetaceae bacterium]|nr:pantoate--beta-alanine ligase [Planctomycetaceae bacterium]